MEAFGVFGILAFVMAAKLMKDVEGLKKEMAAFDDFKNKIEDAQCLNELNE